MVLVSSRFQRVRENFRFFAARREAFGGVAGRAPLRGARGVSTNDTREQLRARRDA